MYKCMILAAGLSLSAAALGQATGGPPIAYVAGGSTGDAIYLVYPDGTGLTKVYQSPSSGRVPGRIERVTIKPGGGEVAFVQNSADLFVQKYDSGGRPLGAAYEIDAPSLRCALYDPDYLSDGSLVFLRSCSVPDVRIVAPGATVSSRLFARENEFAGQAALGTSLVYVESLDDHSLSAELKIRPSGGAATTIAPTTFQFPYFVDANGTRNVAILSDPRGYRLVNLGSGATTAGCTTADMVKYSPSGSQMVYRYRNALFVHNSNCSGAPFRLARGVKSVAWRSD